MSNAEALSFLSAADPDYIASLYARYSKSPSSVDRSWAVLFGGLGDDAKEIIAELQGASWRPSQDKIEAVLSSASNAAAAKPAAKKSAPATGAPVASVSDSLRAYLLIRSYQVRGHLMANLDPLGLMERKYHPELDPATYGFTEADYDRPIELGNMVLGLERASLRQIMAQLQETYCGSIGVEFMHIQIPEEKAWLMEHFAEHRNQTPFSAVEKKDFLQQLTRAEGFENFAQTKYTGTKRFGVEGGEAV
ncbi:MAG: 2-oxoglutarate dehydrogenase E1 component, partial [Alphaproteobacteria bacterium]|nr:2-oxoglutarate dehydrogenase E1 component [Alphaproteobacteria bacterium]